MEIIKIELKKSENDHNYITAKIKTNSIFCELNFALRKNNLMSFYTIEKKEILDKMTYTQSMLIFNKVSQFNEELINPPIKKEGTVL